MEEEKKKSILKKKEIWISIIIGIIIGAGLLFAIQLIPDVGKIGGTIVSSKAGNVTKNDLYDQMRKSYPVSYVLELIDKPILEKKYKLTDEQEKEIEEQVETILKQYEAYGYTEETFCEENGFENKEDFTNYMKLDYRRNLYCIDYFKTLLTDGQIEEYYNNNEIYGTITTKHILIQTSDDVTEQQALKTANEVIAKLNSGTSFDEVSKEYSDTAVTEEVKFNSFEAPNYAESYVNASKALQVGEYTKEAVKTDYGYHVIYCVSKDEKPTLEQAENDIVEALSQDLEAEDQYIRYKALIKLREDNDVKFKDKKFEEEYKKYCDQINGKA
ncbi:MAG: peptidylprolyl isomerase [Clostridia bacterium]|nr:peptidylprolyl isomerase [Clostridia bacterium]